MREFQNICKVNVIKKTRITMLDVGVFVCFWCDSPKWPKASSFTSFLDHTQRRTTFSRTPLDEWSARRKDLYLTTHNTHNRQTSMPPVGFEPTISAGERPQTYALEKVGVVRNTICKTHPITRRAYEILICQDTITVWISTATRRQYNSAQQCLLVYAIECHSTS